MRRLATALAVALLLPARVAHAQAAWMALWNPQMPAAVYNDGSALVESKAPNQSWPWTNSAMSRGLMVIWLKPNDPMNEAWLVHAMPYGYPNNPNEMVQIIVDGLGGVDLGFTSQADPECQQAISGNSCATYYTVSQVVQVNNWQPLFVEWNTATQTYKVYVWNTGFSTRLNLATCDGIIKPDGCTFSVFSSGIELIDFFASLTGVGISEFWLDFGDYDIDAQALRAKFFDNTGHQVYLGPNGERPFGRAPAFYFAAEAIGSRWGCNMSGGPATRIIGNLPRIPGPNAIIEVGPNGWVPTFPAPLPSWPQMKTKGSC